MGLDYKGVPEFSRQRDLLLKKINADEIDAPVRRRPDDPVEDKIFDDIARVYLKGEALLGALGDMNPAHFIPVEPESTVVTSLQRVDPEAESFLVITFGQFKEACEFVANRGQSIDEDFLMSFNIVDPDLEDKVFKRHYQSINSSGDDWISQFLVGGAALAGLMLAGFMTDIFGTLLPRSTVESTSSGNEPKQWFLQGGPVGVALLIELGLNFLALNALFGDSQTLTDDVKGLFEKMDADPAERKKVLSEAGYDYDSLAANQRFNDYKAIKAYALNYISRRPETAQYDHWVAWLQTFETQSMVKNSLALAPTYSSKWRDFRDQGAETGKSGEESIINNTDGDEENEITASLSISVKNYLSSILTLSSDSYDKQFAAFQFQLDERTLCCLIYFLGPMDASTLKTISKILKLFLLKLSLNLQDLLAFLTEGVLTAILSMLVGYANQFLDKIIGKVFDALFSLPDSDIDAAIKLCAGLDFLFRIFDQALQAVFAMVQQIIDQLQLHITQATQKSAAGASIYADRRAVMTIVALLDAIADKLDQVKDICGGDPEANNSITLDDDQAAEAAVAFVVNELPLLFPTLQMPDDLRRKHFSSSRGFTTTSLELNVPGSDENGMPEDVFEGSDPVADCSRESSATQSVVLGQKLAEAFRSFI